MKLKEKVRIIPDYPRQGIRFLDITTLFKDKDAFKELVDKMKEKLEGLEIDVVVGPEARGFVLGATLAYAINAGFVPARKPKKLPADTYSVEYPFGAGKETLQIHKDAIMPGQKVVVIDDLLATGATALAACKLVEQAGGEVVGIVFAMEHTLLGGIDNLKDYNVQTIIKF
jgi:adenine phosphoribosyltransferase